MIRTHSLISEPARRHVASLLALSLLAMLPLSLASRGAQTTASPPAPTTPANAAPHSPPADPTMTIPPATPSLTTPLAQGANPGTASTGPALTLDQVVSQALAVNPQVVLSEERLRRVQYQVRETEAQGYPSISAAVSDTYSDHPTVGGAVSSNTFNVNAGGLVIPSITDAAQGSTFSSSSNTTNTAVTGSGSATSTSTTTNSPTIVPVTPVSSGTSTSSARPVAAKPNATGPGGSGNGNGATLRRLNYGARLSLSQPLDIFGLVATSEKVLKTNVEFYQLELDRVRNELAVTVKTTFFAVLRAQSSLATAQEQVDDSQAVLDNARVRYNAGAAAEFDVVSAQTQLSSAQQSLINAQNTLEVQQANLNNLLNRSLDTPVAVATPPLRHFPRRSTTKPKRRAPIRTVPNCAKPT